MEKMTKKQKEKLEEELRYKRYQFAREVTEYWKDIRAAKQYLGTKSERLSDKEEERLLRRYETLNDYERSYDDDSSEARTWSVIRSIVDSTIKTTFKEPDRYYTIRLDKDDLIISDIIWGIDDVRLIIREAQKYGFKRIFYMDNSTAVMESVSEFIELGGKIEKTVYNTDYNKFGLIINIENAKHEIEYVDDNRLVESIRSRAKKLIENKARNYDIIEDEKAVLREFGSLYNVTDILETYYKIYDEVEEEIKGDKQ